MLGGTYLGSATEGLRKRGSGCPASFFGSADGATGGFKSAWGSHMKSVVPRIGLAPWRFVASRAALSQTSEWRLGAGSCLAITLVRLRIEDFIEKGGRVLDPDNGRSGISGC